VVTCNLGVIPNGGQATVTVVVTPQRAGTFTNGASVNAREPDPNPANNADSKSATATASADLAILKVASPTFGQVGANVSYFLVVRNNGPTLARDVRVVDAIPAGMTLVSATPSQGTCSGTSVLTCELGILANGASADITMVVTATTPGTATNHARVDSREPDPDPSNNTSSADTTTNITPPAEPADLAITIQQPPAVVNVGDRITFNITAANVSSIGTTSDVVLLRLPENTSFVSLTPSRGTCTGTTVFTCNVGNLAPGENVTFALTVTVVSPGTITLTGIVAGAQLETRLDNNRASVQLTTAAPSPSPSPSPTGPVDLAITKTVTKPATSTGDTIVYQLAVLNKSANSASNVVVTDGLPDGTTFVSATPSQGGPCTAADQTVTCPLGTLAPGATATITLTVRADRTGTLTNGAVVRSNETDANYADNVVVTQTDVVTPTPGNADIAVTKTANKSTVNAGDTVIFTNVVRNNGPSTATGVRFVDFLPGGLDLVSVNPSQGTCSTGRLIRCQLGTLASGASATVTITARVSGSGRITNIALANSDLPDPVVPNNGAFDGIDVNPGQVTPVPTPTPGPPPDPNNDDHEDEGVKPDKEKEQDRQQRERTNKGGHDDEATEGNVVGVRCLVATPVPELTTGFVAAPDDVPYVLIATRDGIEEVRLTGEARAACQSIQVGDYLEADGVKQNEQLFDADSVTIHRGGRRVH
jgi:uncharacterized repeat protein (TIGR01451 family)